MENLLYTNVRLHEWGGCGKNSDLCYRYFSVASDAIPGITLDFVYTQHRLTGLEFYFNELILLKVNGTATMAVHLLQDLLATVREENEGKFFTNETIVNLKIEDQ